MSRVSASVTPVTGGCSVRNGPSAKAPHLASSGAGWDSRRKAPHLPKEGKYGPRDRWATSRSSMKVKRPTRPKSGRMGHPLAKLFLDVRGLGHPRIRDEKPHIC